MLAPSPKSEAVMGASVSICVCDMNAFNPTEYKSSFLSTSTFSPMNKRKVPKRNLFSKNAELNTRLRQCKDRLNPITVSPVSVSMSKNEMYRC